MSNRPTLKEEKLLLARRGFVGYVRLDAARTWDGHLYQRLERVQRAADKHGGDIATVRTNGECFHLSTGEPKRVLRDGAPVAISLHARARRAAVRNRSKRVPQPPARKLPPSHGWYAVDANRYAHLDR